MHGPMTYLTKRKEKKYKEFLVPTKCEGKKTTINGKLTNFASNAASWGKKNLNAYTL